MTSAWGSVGGNVGKNGHRRRRFWTRGKKGGGNSKGAYSVIRNPLENSLKGRTSHLGGKEK